MAVAKQQTGATLSRGQQERQFLIGLARAFGGAFIFSLPMFMTMEMWWLGFHMDPWRLILFLAAGVPVLVGLSHFVGFEETFGWLDDLVDSFVAYAVGFVTAGLMLLLFGVVTLDMSLREIVGKVALQALAGAIGAMLAQNQFGQGGEDDDADSRVRSYGGELFIMMVGGLFLAFNVAPTEEMVLISYQMSPWQAAGLMLLSLGLMHAFVYAVQFSGQALRCPPNTPLWSLFLRYSVVGYAIALLVAAFTLWSFGRLDDMGPDAVMMAVIVLAFPAAMGAAAARLIF